MLCEKPLALTAADAAAVVQAERHAGQHLIGLGLMRRFDPSYVELKAIADAGELGDILVAHCVSRTVTEGPGGDSANTITNAAIHELDTSANAESVRLPSPENRRLQKNSVHKSVHKDRKEETPSDSSRRGFP
nr:hypothetical protein [Mycobacterium sp. OTB74]